MTPERGRLVLGISDLPENMQDSLEIDVEEEEKKDEYEPKTWETFVASWETLTEDERGLLSINLQEQRLKKRRYVSTCICSTKI